MMYPSVMQPLPEVHPYDHPDWPPDANALTRTLAEAILRDMGLLQRPMGRSRRRRPPPD